MIILNVNFIILVHLKQMILMINNDDDLICILIWLD